MKGSGVGDSFNLHANPVHPINVLLGFKLANGQAKVMSGRCGAVKTPNMLSGLVMLKYSTTKFHIWND